MLACFVAIQVISVLQSAGGLLGLCALKFWLTIWPLGLKGSTVLVSSKKFDCNLLCGCKTLQLNEDEVENSADDVNDNDDGEQPAAPVSVSPVKTRKKKRKKAKDKSSNDAKAVVLYFCFKQDYLLCCS